MDLADELASWLGGGVRVQDVERLSGGASRLTSSFTAVAPDGRSRSLIVQRTRPGAVSSSGIGMAVEARLLRAAATAGVPVAEVVATSPEGDAVVLDRVEGETIARRILRDDGFERARPVLAAQCGEALGAVHRIPLTVAPELGAPDQLAQYREVLDLLALSSPAFELGFRWLEDRRPAGARTTVVHGDFRLGNLVVGPDGLRAVLDWELAHLGDPLEDLAWLCVKSWRFGAAPRVGGFGSVEDLVGAYGRASGTDVDLDALGWWEVLGTLKWGIMCGVQASAHLSGVTRSVELAAIGRRVCEVEHDLLLLLP